MDNSFKYIYLEIWGHQTHSSCSSGILFSNTGKGNTPWCAHVIEGCYLTILLLIVLLNRSVSLCSSRFILSYTGYPHAIRLYDIGGFTIDHTISTSEPRSQTGTYCHHWHTGLETCNVQHVYVMIVIVSCGSCSLSSSYDDVLGCSCVVCSFLVSWLLCYAAFAGYGVFGTRS